MLAVEDMRKLRSLANTSSSVWAYEGTRESLSEANSHSCFFGSPGAAMHGNRKHFKDCAPRRSGQISEIRRSKRQKMPAPARYGNCIPPQPPRNPIAFKAMQQFILMGRDLNPWWTRA